MAGGSRAGLRRADGALPCNPASYLYNVIPAMQTCLSLGPEVALDSLLPLIFASVAVFDGSRMGS